MTEEQAVKRARAVAEAEGWPWEEPIKVQPREAGLLFGAPYWEIRTNAATRGRNAEIIVDYHTGEVLSKNWCPR